MKYIAAYGEGGPLNPDLHRHVDHDLPEIDEPEPGVESPAEVVSLDELRDRELEVASGQVAA